MINSPRIRNATFAVVTVLVLLGATLQAEAVDRGKGIRFLKAKHPCSVWTASDLPQLPNDLEDKVTCIFYGTNAEGTVDEQQGCMLASYDLSEDSYTSWYVGRPPVIRDGLKCTVKVVEQLLDKAGTWGKCDSARMGGLLVGGSTALMPFLKKRFAGCAQFADR